MDDNEKTIKELIDSLNHSIEDIREHPTQPDKLPSNFEILVRGVSDSSAIDFLFSSKLDKLIDGMFNKINSGDFESIINNESTFEKMLDNVFGEGSFRGPISQSVLNNIQISVQSKKFQNMKSNLGKSMATLKKIKLVIKNLERGGKELKTRPEEYKKYKDAVYAIKKVIKFAARVYSNRRIINRKVFNGLNNIVHEEFFIDEPLI